MVLIQFILPSNLWLFSFKSAISDQNQLMPHGVLAITRYCQVMDVTAVSGFDGSSLLQNLVSIWHGHARAKIGMFIPLSFILCPGFRST